MKMTSTSINVGINEGTRLSSRVLRPPGGGHTDIFGGEPEPPRAGGRRPAPSVLANMQTAQSQGQGDEPAKPTNGAEAPSQNGQASEPAPPPEAPAPPAPQVTPTAPASSPTEEKADAPKAKADAPKAVTPTESKPDAPKRVRVPPGGFSSGLW